MIGIFVDTALLVSLLSAKDAHHAAASSLSARFERARARLITTDAVLIEFGNYFSRLPQRNAVSGWISRIRASADWEVVSLDPHLLAQAEARYERARDKNWSLTDCISMEVMQSRGIREIATTDRGFAQAGFEPLL